MTTVYTNNATSRLASAIASTDLTFSVATGDGALFPALSGGDTCVLCLQSSTAREFVLATARSTDTFTVTRAQESTTAVGFAAGDTVSLFLTAGEINAIIAAIAGKAGLASPAFTGTPAAPTASTGTNTTQLATTAFVHGAVADVINAAPGALDTLKELADAINDDASFASTVTTSLATKAPLASPAFTGTPTAPTATSGTNTTQVATTAFVAAAVSGGGGGSTLSRATVTKTTASLADLATENSTVTLAKTTALIKITADRACRVVLYSTSAARSTDATRVIGNPATPGTGVLAEFVFPTAGSILVSPVTLLANGDSSPTTVIYYAITNRSGSTSTVQVDFLHLALE